MGWREIMGVQAKAIYPHNPQKSEQDHSCEDCESSEPTPIRNAAPKAPTRSGAEEWRASMSGRLPPPAHPGERSEAQAFARRVKAWLCNNPASSPPDCCAECGGADVPGNVLLPHGIGPHVWLHSACWPVWCDGRVEQARKALAAQGIMEDACADPPQV